MSRVTTAGTRWRSLYGRWYLRHSALVYLLVRVTLTMALAWARQPVRGIEVAVLVVCLAPFVTWVDRVPRATRVLMANLGFTRGELLLATALVSAALEPIMQAAAIPVLASIVGGMTLALGFGR